MNEPRNVPPHLARLRAALAQDPAPEVWIRFPHLLGDVLFVLPFIYGLQDAWNAEAAALGKRIRWVGLGHTMGAALLSDADPAFFAEIRLDERDGKEDPLALGRRWRRGPRPVAVLTLCQSARLAAAAWIGRVPVRAGIADHGMRILYHASVSYRGRHQHLTARLGDLSRALGLPAPYFRLLGPELLGGRKGVETLREAGWDGQEALVALAPGTRGDFKRWQPEAQQWPRLAECLAERGFRPVILGTREEAPLAEAIRARVPRALDLIGRTTLPEVAAILHAAGAVVAVDTGLAHLSAAVGGATVTLFGASHEGYAQPVGPWSLALRGQPIRMTEDEDLGADHRMEATLTRLDPERVAWVATGLIEERHRALAGGA